MSKIYEMYMEEVECEMECGELDFFLVECPLCGCEVQEDNLMYGVCTNCALN